MSAFFWFPSKDPLCYSGHAAWGAGAGTIPELLWCCFLASIFWRKPAVRVKLGGNLCAGAEGTLHSSAHLLQGSAVTACNMPFPFAVAVLTDREGLQPLPAVICRYWHIAKWTNLSQTWFCLFWLSSMDGLRLGWVSSGSWGSYDTFWRPAASDSCSA